MLLFSVIGSKFEVCILNICTYTASCTLHRKTFGSSYLITGPKDGKTVPKPVGCVKDVFNMSDCILVVYYYFVD
jgi:hypothetical protein